MVWLRRVLWAVVALIALAGLALVLADTRWGHARIAEQITAQRPKSGLVIGIGAIEGSIYGQARVRGLTLSDPQGRFFEAPEVALDWRPLHWFSNLLDIRSLDAETATLLRLPKLKPGAKDAPILPAFDISIGSLNIRRLMIAKGVAGDARQGRVTGKADIRSGRALVDLSVDAGKGDLLALKLDAEPDRNRFDLDAKLVAPAGGVFGTAVGTTLPFTADVKGDGNWQAWQGQATLRAADAQVAALALKANDGRYGVDGTVSLASLTKGKVQRLVAPSVRVLGQATLANRRLTGRLQARSAAIAADATGGIDLGRSSFSNLLVSADLLQPEALFPTMSARNLNLKARFDGPFSTARFEYLLAAPWVKFDQTGLEDVRATGQGRLSPLPIQLPVKFAARRVTGVGDVAGGILSNLRAEGVLLVSATTLTGDGLLVRSDKFNGKISLLVDLRTGLYDIGLLGTLNRYHIPGLGVVDVKADLKVVPGANGKGSRIMGRGQAWVRSWENNFLATLAGGLPVIDTGLSRGPDGALYLTDLRLTAPALSLSGNGVRRRDGSFHFEGSGRQATYGSLRLVLDGRIERPRLEIILARPNDAMGLSNVKLLLDPDAAGYRWQAAGGSMLGPFTGNGMILMPKGGQVVIDIARLQSSGMVATGRIEPRPGGLLGTLSLSGGGISGTLALSPQGRIQRIDAKVSARDARFEGPPVLSARRGQFNGTILLDPAGLKVDGTLTGEGLARGNLRLARLAANLKMTGENSEIRASFAGARGRSFEIQTLARGRGNVWQVEGGGTIDRRPIRLLQAAELRREDGGWRLMPVEIAFAGGKARTSGLFGANSSAFQATLSAMPLGIADIVSPGLGLGGTASGSIDYRFAKGGSPEGKADLRIKGLTRSGLVLASAPVDMGIVAQLSAGSAGLRAIAVSKGNEIGRAQAKLTPGPGPDVFTRLGSAPVFAQLRYAGAADTLWRLTGVEALDIAGGVSIAADVTGRVDDPSIRGSLRTTNARIESPLTGMVLTQVEASGRFGGGSLLVIDQLRARAGKDGSISARGQIDLSSARGFGLDILLDTQNARLIERDDFAATTTGSLRIRSESGQGVISGDVVLERSRFQLGRTTTAQAIPKLNVREINKPEDAAASAAPSLPWKLALKAKAPARLSVTGLGLESEWKADLEIGGTPYAPILRGRADLIRGGYDFAGRRFDLKRGQIRFQGESPPDPILDILAEGNAQGLTASIRVTGTGLKPVIAFSSVPSLPEDELLSRMLFGTSIANLSAPEAIQLAAAVASLQGGGDGLSPINALRKAVGLDRLRILPGDTETGQGTSVSAGKYIGRRAYVEVVTDGKGYSATRAEFQVTRWLSILSSISSIGQQSAAVRISKDY